MSKIGSYDYPDTQIGTLLKALEILVKTFKGETKEEGTFAKAIGHSNTKSGGYLQKVADLRRYGFMEKGRFTVTANGKKIIQPLYPEEKQTALNEGIMGITLWKDLYDRLNGAIPSPEDFKIHISEITGDRDRAYKEGDKIRNLYIDALKYYNEGADKTAKKNSSQSDKKIDKGNEEEKVPEQLIVLRSGETDVSMKKTEANINILISILTELKKELSKDKK